MEENLILLSRDTKITNKKSSFQSWKSSWRKKAKSERIILWIMLCLFTIYSFTLVYPVVWALINSFKPATAYDIDNIGLPDKPTLENYKTVFDLLSKSNVTLFQSIWNSIWMSTVSTFLGLAASSLTSYVVAKYKFKMSGFIYAAVIFIQVIPLVGGITGMYKLINITLDIGNSPLQIWPIWFGGFGFSFLMLYSAFKSVPWSYAESAFIDGASHFTVFFKIMLPAVKPVLASLFIVNFIGAWNDYMTAYLYMPDYAPLALTVYQFQQDVVRGAGGVPAYLAVLCISIIPPLILFICFQKLIMENTTAGGLKG